MSNLSINNQALNGQIYKLNIPEGKTVYDIRNQGEDDTLDQVYFKVGDDVYVAEGDGLDFTEINKRALPKVEFFDGNSSHHAQLLAVDDEVNTAWEGVKNVGAASLTLATGGLLGGGAMVGKGVVQIAPTVTLMNEGVSSIKAGYLLFESGMIPMQKGMSQSIGAVQKMMTSPVPTPPVKPPSGILDRVINKVSTVVNTGKNTVGKVTAIPQVTDDVVQGLDKIKKGSAVVEKGLETTGQSIQKFDQTMKVVEKSTGTFKKGAYIIGAGLAIAGTVAIGGALYGAFRGGDDSGIDSFKAN